MPNKINEIERKIAVIKLELQNLGAMRPGTLTKQYKNPKNKEGGYYQLSYTHKMKSKTEYVRLQFLEEIKRETENYKIFKRLTEEWSDLALQLSQL
ncbi:MAG: hypothetical protein GY804_05215, partial [Alphaproteobacteria bacterium]|nr:hypothetical protein [Alphaproteobacteria bacterium]